jgi:hypothetical protein
MLYNDIVDRHKIYGTCHAYRTSYYTTSTGTSPDENSISRPAAYWCGLERAGPAWIKNVFGVVLLEKN